LTPRPRTIPSSAATPRARAGSAPSAVEVLRIAAEAAVARKARAPVALDLRELECVCDYFFICSAASEPQVKAIAEAVEDKLRERGVRPWHVEGFESRRWVLLDFVEVVVHVFHEKTREYYMLDRLWGDARSLDLGLDSAD
jgi:ribosome-associated protein